jgi:putative peptidoglycan lipid II flippase
VLNKALTPSFFGRHDTKTPVKASAAALVVNIALNLALMPYLGHVGIAVGTSVSAWLNAGVLAFILYRRGHLMPDARLKKRLPRTLLATLVMAAALWGGLMVVEDQFWALFGLPDVASGDLFTRSVVLLVLIAGGAVVFALAALVLGAAKRSDLDSFRRKRAS